MIGKKLIALACGISLLLLGGCAGTKLVKEWHEPEYSGPQFSKVLIVGISRVPHTRADFENEFSRDLIAKGLSATASHTLITPKGKIDKEEIKAAVQEYGFDSILTTRLVSQEQKSQFPSSAGYDRGFHAYYGSAWGVATQGSHMRDYQVVTLETNLYAAGTWAMVWSGTTEFFKSEKKDEEIKNLSDVIVEALQKKKLLVSSE